MSLQIDGSAASLAGLRARATDRAELVALGLLALGWAALWLATVPVGNHPLNDDWVYALAVRSVVETGRYALPSPATANVFAQIYWGALFCLPFGFSFTALHVSTFVLGAVGVLATFLLLRELGAGRLLAGLGALTLAVNPLYLSQSVTFMTDVPFTALVAASLWLYVRGVNRDERWAVAGAMLVAFAAILVRQFAIMLPLGFAVAHVARRGVRPRALLVAALPVVIGAVLHGGYERWVVSTGRTPLVFAPISTLMPKSVAVFVYVIFHMTARILPYLGLFLTPFALGLLALRGFAVAIMRPWVALLGTAAIGVGLLAVQLPRGIVLPGLGNILLPSAIGPLTLPDMYLLDRNLPELPAALSWLWPAATVWSAFVIGFVLLVVGARLVRVAGAVWRGRSLRPAWAHLLLLTVAGAYAAGLFVLGNQSFWFDRYLILFIPPLLGLLVLAARGAEPRRMALAGAALVLYGLFSVVQTHDYLAWNRARWRALAFLERSGVAPRQIDGGYEFNGWYLYDPQYQHRPGKSYWWVIDNEFMVTAGPLPGFKEVASFPYHRWLNLGQGQVLALQRVP